MSAIRNGTILVVLALLAGVPSAQAANQALIDLLDVLKANGTLAQDAYDVLRNSALADEEQEKATDAQVVQVVDTRVKEVAAKLPAIRTDGRFSVADENFEWRIGGRLMHDAAFWNNDGSFVQADGQAFRRMRIDLLGRVFRDWNYKIVYDFTDADDGVVGFRDAYVEYVGLKPMAIMIGQTYEPFGLDVQTSSKYITFIERSMGATGLGDAPAFGSRNPGIMLSGTVGDQWTLWGGLFATKQEVATAGVTTTFTVPPGGLVAGSTVTTTGTGGSDDDPARNFDDGYAVTGRVTWSPWHEATRALHFGAAASLREFRDNMRVRIRERPEVAIAPRTVDTGNFNADSYLRFGLEAAWVQGPFSLQGEYMHLTASSPTGAPDPSFQSYYLQGSWFLTGESRNYHFASGRFEGVKPRVNLGAEGLGAFEIAARISHLDLSDESVTGGVQDNLTFGLNWYPNSNMRFMANYVVVLDIDGGPNDGSQPSAFVLRSQFHW